MSEAQSRNRVRLAASRVAQCLAAVVGFLLLMQPAEAHAIEAHIAVPAYPYGSPHHADGRSNIAIERAPPAVACDYTPAPFADDHGSHGASARPQLSSARAYAACDHTRHLAHRDRGTVTTLSASVGSVADVRAIADSRCAAKSGSELRRVGDALESIDDVMANPQLLAGRHPAVVENALKDTPGWRVEKLGDGSQAGRGWVFRQYTERGHPTGPQLRWHPGGGHHGPDPYWRVVGPNGDLGGIIR